MSVVLSGSAIKSFIDWGAMGTPISEWGSAALMQAIRYERRPAVEALVLCGVPVEKSAWEEMVRLFHERIATSRYMLRSDCECCLDLIGEIESTLRRGYRMRHPEGDAPKHDKWCSGLASEGTCCPNPVKWPEDALGNGSNQEPISTPRGRFTVLLVNDCQRPCIP